MSLNRRDLLSAGVKSLLTASLVSSLQSLGMATDAGRDVFEDWLRLLNENGRRLGCGEQSPLQWQERMDQILSAAPLRSLLQFVDFDRLSHQLQHGDLGTRGEIFVPVDMNAGGRVVERTGPESGRMLITKIAHIRRGRSIPPHGHSNMTSAFLCVCGRFDIRLYDRLEEFDDHMIVRQTADSVDVGPGSWSSISDYRSNVHWLTAKTDDCFLFTSKLIHLEEHRQSRGRINIDVVRGDVLGTDTIRAPKISGAEAAERY